MECGDFNARIKHMCLILALKSQLFNVAQKFSYSNICCSVYEYNKNRINVSKLTKAYIL